MATINHKTYNEGTETFKDFSVYDGKDTLIFKVDGSAQSAAVTGTLAVSGNATFDTTTLVVDATNNRVGVGTATPASTLDVSGTLAVSGNATFDTNTLIVDATNNRLAMGGATVSGYRLNVYGLQRMIGTDTVLNFGELDSNANYFQSLNIAGDTGKDTVFFSTAERMRITAAGVLDLNQGQIKFPATQVPSADANTLDDYEEGTWTMGVSFGGASVGVTYSANTGTYTKIGRQVTANGYLALTNKGSSTGQARITGLPFTIGASSGFFSTAGVWMYEVSFANQFQAYGELNTTGIVLSEVTEAGAYTVLNDANFANNTEIMISLTYFV
jgi:hypothetical protein